MVKQKRSHVLSPPVKYFCEKWFVTDPGVLFDPKRDLMDHEDVSLKWHVRGSLTILLEAETPAHGSPLHHLLSSRWGTCLADEVGTDLLLHNRNRKATYWCFFFSVGLIWAHFFLPDHMRWPTSTAQNSLPSDSNSIGSRLLGAWRES